MMEIFFSKVLGLKKDFTVRTLLRPIRDFINYLKVVTIFFNRGTTVGFAEPRKLILWLTIQIKTDHNLQSSSIK